MKTKGGNKEEEEFHIVREQDRYLPIANGKYWGTGNEFKLLTLLLYGSDTNINNIDAVSRIMRRALPSYGKLSKEASECMQECVSEFISFITSQSAEKCSIERRKTLNGEDILYSMYTLGFENYAEALKIYLAKYREFEQEESEIRRQKYLIRKERKRRERLAKKMSSNLSNQDTTRIETLSYDLSNEDNDYEFTSKISDDNSERDSNIWA